MLRWSWVEGGEDSVFICREVDLVYVYRLMALLAASVVLWTRVRPTTAAVPLEVAAGPVRHGAGWMVS